MQESPAWFWEVLGLPRAAGFKLRSEGTGRGSQACVCVCGEEAREEELGPAEELEEGQQKYRTRAPAGPGDRWEVSPWRRRQSHPRWLCSVVPPTAPDIRSFNNPC